MPNYAFAGLTVRIQNRYPFLERQCRAFLCEDAAPADITVEVTDEDILAEKKNAGSGFSPGYIESVCAYRKLCLQMPKFGGLFLHSSVIRTGGRGIAFLAQSGTGKTTHTALWKDLLGDGMEIINGDKPIVRFLGGCPVAYGTPWAGKEDLYCNDSTVLTDLCFLERAQENSCTPLKPEDCIPRIVHQVIVPADPQNALLTLDLVDRLLKACRIWLIRCNTDISAAQTAYSAIMK